MFVIVTLVATYCGSPLGPQVPGRRTSYMVPADSDFGLSDGYPEFRVPARDGDGFAHRIPAELVASIAPATTDVVGQPAFA